MAIENFTQVCPASQKLWQFFAGMDWQTDGPKDTWKLITSLPLQNYFCPYVWGGRRETLWPHKISTSYFVKDKKTLFFIVKNASPLRSTSHRTQPYNNTQNSTKGGSRASGVASMSKKFQSILNGGLLCKPPELILTANRDSGLCQIKGFIKQILIKVNISSPHISFVFARPQIPNLNFANPKTPMFSTFLANLETGPVRMILTSS